MTSPVTRSLSPAPEHLLEEEDEFSIYARLVSVQIKNFKIIADARVPAGDKALIRGRVAEGLLKSLSQAPKVLKAPVLNLSYPNGTKAYYPQEAAECVGSRDILEFKANNKPKLLYFVSHDDEIGVSSPKRDSTCKVLKDLNTAYNMKYVVAAKIKDVYAELKKLPPSSLSGMVFDMHGTRSCICLTEDWDGAITDRQAAEVLKDKAFIHLITCEAADSEKSPLYKMRDSLIPLGKKILLSGPITTIINDSIHIKSTLPLRVEYKYTEQQCKNFSVPTDLPCKLLPKDNHNPDLINVTCEISTKP